MQPWEFTAEAFPYLHKKGAYAKPLNQTTDLARNIKRINRDELHNEYRKLIECAAAPRGRGANVTLSTITECPHQEEVPVPSVR